MGETAAHLAPVGRKLQPKANSCSESPVRENHRGTLTMLGTPGGWCLSWFPPENHANRGPPILRKSRMGSNTWIPSGCYMQEVPSQAEACFLDPIDVLPYLAPLPLRAPSGSNMQLNSAGSLGHWQRFQRKGLSLETETQSIRGGPNTRHPKRRSRGFPLLVGRLFCEDQIPGKQRFCASMLEAPSLGVVLVCFYRTSCFRIHQRPCHQNRKSH